MPKHETLDDYVEGALGGDAEHLTADEKANLAWTYIRRLEDRVAVLESRLEAASATAEGGDA